MNVFSMCTIRISSRMRLVDVIEWAAGMSEGRLELMLLVIVVVSVGKQDLNDHKVWKCLG